MFTVGETTHLGDEVDGKVAVEVTVPRRRRRMRGERRRPGQLATILVRCHKNASACWFVLKNDCENGVGYRLKNSGMSTNHPMFKDLMYSTREL